ncbi:lipopolysaccharide biosynthesis protein [Antarcticibacterium flavum]|uniref:Lipopolysaccharide biosynthesis protein n=1 Tax=Antarcticibacterium flavum TaxID=2058175 RepID=A0A5B7WYJ2_9FLAO|nr:MULTISPECIES: polysaccharide biosynthesis C-terminal domain-containing protein [Antarcticibacterium]MCM4158995.1 sugar isomerase [Antarcticibacterium sp. W02-3]QCY68246.1 lipopolysaccharide biosynthesis protein [Antarcticibacterium flavum]
MGIIINQSFKNMVTTYFGFGIGAVNTLFLFTYFLEKEYYGLISFLLSAANLIWPLMAFGVHNTLVKFYSSYKTRETRDKFLTLILVLPLMVSLLLGLLGFFSYSLLLDYFSGGNELVQPYVWLIFVIAVATAYFEVFFAWSKVNYHSVFGNFMKEVFHRICITVLLFLVFLEVLSVEYFVYAMAGVFLLRAGAMQIYAFSLYKPKFNFSLPYNIASILKYSALILIAGSVAMILLDLDKVMIEHYLPIGEVAVYGIAVYIATVISVPQKAMHQITHPLTANLLNEKDREGLDDLYKRSSLSLLVVSALIFILIIVNLNMLYELIPEEYQMSTMIVLLISLVKLYDNMLGNNNSILFNSDYYRLVLVVGVFLAILAFVFNLIFIPLLGIFGAALATFLAFSIYNTSKIFLVFQKFKMHPFSRKTLIILLFTAVLTAGFYYWEFPFHPIINIILKSALVSIVYMGAALRFGFSSDVTGLVSGMYSKVTSSHKSGNP